MKPLMAIAAMALLLAIQPAWTAEAQKKSATGTEQKSQAKPEKKSPGATEKAGNSVKSGWNSFTKSVKQGAKKPACTPEQKSLKQCQ